ncbi:hypothetical protein KUTeg_010495, partial [Tegillarca granosa]
MESKKKKFFQIRIKGFFNKNKYRRKLSSLNFCVKKKNFFVFFHYVIYENINCHQINNCLKKVLSNVVQNVTINFVFEFYVVGSSPFIQQMHSTLMLICLTFLLAFANNIIPTIPSITLQVVGFCFQIVERVAVLTSLFAFLMH